MNLETLNIDYFLEIIWDSLMITTEETKTFSDIQKNSCR